MSTLPVPASNADMPQVGSEVELYPPTPGIRLLRSSLPGLQKVALLGYSAFADTIKIKSD